MKTTLLLALLTPACSLKLMHNDYYNGRVWVASAQIFQKTETEALKVSPGGELTMSGHHAQAQGEEAGNFVARALKKLF